MASAAEFSGFVESLFLTKSIPQGDSLGQYRLKLFDGEAWQEIIIDDQIPTIQGKPAFSKPADNELWAMLLEKAVAKLCGNYAATEGGIWNAGWLMFTGCMDQWSFKNPNGFNGNWTKTTMKFNPKTHAGRPLGGEVPEAELGCEEMWESLQQWDKDNFLMGAGTFKQGRMSGRTGHSGGESVRADGLVKGHAYSLLQCVELDADGQHWRMVQLRNPWGPSQPGGESTEWSGRFSDGDAAWNENPELRRALDFEEKDDGIFWMSWEDFVECFDGIYVSGAPVSVPKRSALKKLSIAAYEGAMSHFNRLDPLKKLGDVAQELAAKLGDTAQEMTAKGLPREEADVSTNVSDAEAEPAAEAAPATPEHESVSAQLTTWATMPGRGGLGYRTVWVEEGAERPVVTLPPQYIVPGATRAAPEGQMKRAQAVRAVWVEEGAERPVMTLPPQYITPKSLFEAPSDGSMKVLGYRCPVCQALQTGLQDALVHCRPQAAYTPRF